MEDGFDFHLRVLQHYFVHPSDGVYCNGAKDKLLKAYHFNREKLTERQQMYDNNTNRLTREERAVEKSEIKKMNKDVDDFVTTLNCWDDSFELIRERHQILSRQGLDGLLEMMFQRWEERSPVEEILLMLPRYQVNGDIFIDQQLLL